MRILVPIQSKDDGSSFYRIVTPSAYFSDDIELDFLHFKRNKFASSPFRFHDKSFQKISDSIWDRLKVVERKRVLKQQHTYDFVWISRSLLSFSNPVEPKIKRIIYDIDDAVWLGEARHIFEFYCKNAGLVIAGNQFLAERASAFTRNIVVIPTSIDTARYKRTAHKKNVFTIGWIGSSAGYKYLQMIEDSLVNFLYGKKGQARLIIMSERYPETLERLRPFLTYIPWNRDFDVQVINEFSVGIMPLEDTEWDRGKCSFKMIQYMACEVPVLVSPIGMNLEVMQLAQSIGRAGELVRNDEWEDALEVYYDLSERDLDLQGINGRKIALQHFDTGNISKKIECSIKGI